MFAYTYIPNRTYSLILDIHTCAYTRSQTHTHRMQFHTCIKLGKCSCDAASCAQMPPNAMKMLKENNSKNVYGGSMQVLWPKQQMIFVNFKFGTHQQNLFAPMFVSHKLRRASTIAKKRLITEWANKTTRFSKYFKATRWIWNTSKRYQQRLKDESSKIIIIISCSLKKSF